MLEPVLLSTFWDVIWATFIVMFVFVPLVLLWTFALVDLFVRRDLRWRKVMWLVVIVVIPVFGALVYLLVRPDDYVAPYEGAARDA